MYLTMLQRRVAFEFFNAMAKMVELDFFLVGFLEESPLIYLKHYSKMDICRSCLIAFMLNSTPFLILCHD